MATLTPVPKIQFFDANGNPLAGGKLYSYDAGTTAPRPTYTDYGGGTPNANPVILDSRGEANVWLDSALYKLKLTSATDVEIWTVDNVGGAATLAQLAASGGSALVGFIQAGTGAVTRTVQAKLREVASVLDFGAVGDGVTDDTTAIQNAINAAERVYFPVPASAYLVSSINIPANRTLDTENVSVKFQQKTGQPVGTRVLKVMGPNVTIGDMTIQGNIATDTDEQSHGIIVNSGVAGTSLYNVRIGNIRGINIRGDVVYIGQTVASGTTSNVSVASADGSNILRNVVSIVGGSDIDIGQVTGSAVGYMHVDFEPDGTNTGNNVNVRVGQVKGRHIGVVVNNPSGSSVFNENVQFGEVNLDPAFATQSTPAYAPGATIANRGVLLRSSKDIYIGTLKVNGYDGSAIWLESGGVADISLVIGQAFLSDCNKTDGNVYGYVVCPNVVFGYLNATTPASTGGVNRRIIQANNCVVHSGNFSLGESSSVVRNGSRCFVGNSTIVGQGGVTGTYVAVDANGLKLQNCAISAIERLAGFMTGLDVDNCTVTTTVAVLNTVTQATYKRSTIQSQYYAFATGDRTYTEAIAFGTQFLWVDSTGDLRIKSGAPTSDTDGTVVGTQT